MNVEAIAQLPQPQRDRLKHIELRLRFLGEVRRADLMARFGIQSAASSRDLALYKELAPFNAEFDQRSKLYVLGQGFAPLFETQPEQALSWLVEQVGDVVAPTSDSLLPCSMRREKPPHSLRLLTGRSRPSESSVYASNSVHIFVIVLTFISFPMAAGMSGVHDKSLGRRAYLLTFPAEAGRSARRLSSSRFTGKVDVGDGRGTRGKKSSSETNDSNHAAPCTSSDHQL